MNYMSMAEDKSIVSKIEETLRLGFNTAEGAKLVGIYDDGYRAVVQLLAIRDRNKDPLIRKKAHDFIMIVNANNGPGENLSDIKAFITTYFEKGHKAYSWSKVRSPGKYDIEERLKELLDRHDLDAAVKNKATEFLNSIVDGRIMTHLLKEASSLVAKNKISLKKLSKKNNETQSFVHAIDHACNSCENLSDIQMSFVPEPERAVLIARLCDAAMVLLKLQSKLIGG